MGWAPSRARAPPPAYRHDFEYSECDPLCDSSPRISRIDPVHYTSVDDLKGFSDSRRVDPVLRIAELDGVFRHDAGDLGKVGPHLIQHLPLRCGAYLFVRLALAEIAREGLLANDVLARLDGFQNQREMKGVGDTEIDDINGRIIEKEAIVAIDLGDAEAAGQLLGMIPGLAGYRGNFHGDFFHLMIGSKMKRGRKPAPTIPTRTGFFMADPPFFVWD